MKYLATCPACEERLPRSWIWRTGALLRPCPGCGTPLQQNPAWLRWGNRLAFTLLPLMGGGGSILGVLFVHEGAAIPGMGVGVGLWLALGYFLFPYVSPYEGHVPVCSKCHYNLTGNTSGVCPECGNGVARRERSGIRSFRFKRALFGIAFIITFVLLGLSIAGIWGHIEIHLGSWLFEVRSGYVAFYQPPGPHDGMTQVATLSADSSDAAIVPGYFLLFLILGYALVRRHHEAKMKEIGHCHKCGYNLTGNTSGVCPECGSVVGEESIS